MSLENLRTLIGLSAAKHQREFYPFSLLEQGFPRGALIEISGPGKSELVSQFLAQNSILKVAWIERQLNVLPVALAQRNVDLDRVLFCEAGHEIYWVANQVLRSRLFQVIVLSDSCHDLKVLRRLQLASEKSNVCFIFLSERSQYLWPISLQIQVTRRSLDDAMNVHVLRSR